MHEQFALLEAGSYGALHHQELPWEVFQIIKESDQSGGGGRHGHQPAPAPQGAGDSESPGAGRARRRPERHGGFRARRRSAQAAGAQLWGCGRGGERQGLRGAHRAHRRGPRGRPSSLRRGPRGLPPPRGPGVAAAANPVLPTPRCRGPHSPQGHNRHSRPSASFPPKRLGTSGLQSLPGDTHVQEGQSPARKQDGAPSAGPCIELPEDMSLSSVTSRPSLRTVPKHSHPQLAHGATGRCPLFSL
ncbi:serine/arginine repetitive matrix protein 3-like [Camelus ferus]|uniref:Serine/arginine repetitive matrix protein 3-like n=1 Tax=Camelus ferus TaxID=419612 RepID=A0A8B8T3X5_CAMFR|nr:serine/arginine repetitive matrix protein 3-like [Camelus ferus]